MINHLRCLILNQGGSTGTAFDEFIPESFQGMALNSDETRLRNLIIRDSHPRDFREFAATALTRVVYGTDLGARFIDPIDPRVTISKDTGKLSSLSSSIILERVAGGTEMNVFGTYSPKADAGIFSNTWTITAINNTTAFLEDARLQSTRTETLSFSSGLGAAIRLEPESNLITQFNNEPTVFPSISKITASVPPSVNLLGMLSRLRQEERVGAFIDSLALPDLASFYHDRLSPMNALAAALCAYCISVSSRIS